MMVPCERSRLVEYGDRVVKRFHAPSRGTHGIPAVPASLTNAFNDTGMLTFQVDTRRDLWTQPNRFHRLHPLMASHGGSSNQC